MQLLLVVIIIREVADRLIRSYEALIKIAKRRSIESVISSSTTARQSQVRRRCLGLWNRLISMCRDGNCGYKLWIEIAVSMFITLTRNG
jgi:hypothetical protein